MLRRNSRFFSPKLATTTKSRGARPFRFYSYFAHLECKLVRNALADSGTVRFFAGRGIALFLATTHKHSPVEPLNIDANRWAELRTMPNHLAILRRKSSADWSVKSRLSIKLSCQT